MRDADPRIVLGLHRSRHERRLLTGALDLGVTSIDTSSNYHGFRSHEALARTAGDLLPKFRLSTKVGYFPEPDGAEHTLAPGRLYGAVEKAVRDLGREPDAVFLHNPEHSLDGGTAQSRDVLAQACAALDEAASSGLCGAWGVASWNPSPLASLIDTTTPRPSAFMVRAGLLVGTRTLDAADAAATAWGLNSSAVWGMSPFGGRANARVWDRIDSRVFLRDGAGFSPVQAAFRAAYGLPKVGTVAVGTDNPAHLSDLLGALTGQVDERAIEEYRALLRARSHGQPA
jgi:pyridoxine 4-dehydrogenase